MKTDPNTGRSRGFAFIVFSQADSIDKVCSLAKLLTIYVGFLSCLQFGRENLHFWLLMYGACVHFWQHIDLVSS